jgi:hypothetical protein
MTVQRTMPAAAASGTDPVQESRSDHDEYERFGTD